MSAQTFQVMVPWGTVPMDIEWGQDWQPKSVIAVTWPWESQVWQYPQEGKPGIRYYRGDIPDSDYFVDCLLFYGKDGRLHGILNYYDDQFDHPESLERPGNVNVFVDPKCRRQGIGSALLDEAVKRWGVDLTAQAYSVEGMGFIDRYLGRKPEKAA